MWVGGMVEAMRVRGRKSQGSSEGLGRDKSFAEQYGKLWEKEMLHCLTGWNPRMGVVRGGLVSRRKGTWIGREELGESEKVRGTMAP